MSAPITYVDFVEGVLGLTMSRAQRVAARIAFDGAEPCDLSGDDRDIARRLFGDVETVPPAARAVFVGVFGARGGKSYFFGALYSLWRALTADLSTLAPGELAVALVVAPDLRLARQAIRYALGAAKGVPAIAQCITAETADGLVLRRPDGHSVSIEALPATRGGSALRGRSLVSAVLDECAFFRDETSVVNDAELFRAVSPRVMRGGRVVLISTAFAELGLLYEEFQRNFGHPTTALAAQAPTELMREDDPAILAMVARERIRDPDNARCEYDAQFRTSGGTLVFDAAAIDKAFERTIPRTDRTVAYKPIGVLDMSSGGKNGDATAAAVIQVVHPLWDFRRADGRTVIQRQVYDDDWALRGPRTVYAVQSLETGELEPFDPPDEKPLIVMRDLRIIKGGFWGHMTGEDLMSQVTTMIRAWGVREVWADSFERGLAQNELRKSGIRLVPNTWNSDSKHQAVQRIRRWLSDGHLVLPANDTLRNELKNYQRTPLAGGTFRYAAKGSKHDDTVALLINAAIVETSGALQGSELFNRLPANIVD